MSQRRNFDQNWPPEIFLSKSPLRAVPNCLYRVHGLVQLSFVYLQGWSILILDYPDSESSFLMEFPIPKDESVASHLVVHLLKSLTPSLLHSPMR